MNLKEVSKPKTKLEKSDSPTLKNGPWSVTGWYGEDGEYYERFKAHKKEKWFLLVDSSEVA